MGQLCNYGCNYMLVFFKYKYNVKTCMYTISPLNQIINFNVSTWYLKPLNIKWDQKFALLLHK